MKSYRARAVWNLVFYPARFIDMAVEHAAGLDKGRRPPADEATDATTTIRRAIGFSFLLVAIATGGGWALGRLSSLLFGGLATTTIGAINLVGIGVLLWATLAKQGWNIQTYAGKSLPELVDQTVYRGLYLAGSFLLAFAAATTARIGDTAPPVAPDGTILNSLVHSSSAWLDTLTIDQAEKLSKILQAITTTAAIIVGAIWFLRRRENKPRATTAHQVSHVAISNDHVVLRIALSVTNKGNVPVCPTHTETRIQQVLPLADEARAALADGTMIPENEPEVLWPLLDVRRRSWMKGDLEIEPGESDTIHNDFVLHHTIERVVVYSYVKNITKRRREIGWSVTTFYDLKSGSVEENSSGLLPGPPDAPGTSKG